MTLLLPRRFPAAQRAAIRKTGPQGAPVHHDAQQQERRAGDDGDDRIPPGVPPDKRRGHAEEAESDPRLAAAAAFHARPTTALPLDDDLVGGPGVEQHSQADETDERPDD